MGWNDLKESYFNENIENKFEYAFKKLSKSTATPQKEIQVNYLK